MAARRAVQRGDIDPPIELSPNVIAWTHEAVERYLATRPRRVPPPPGAGRSAGRFSKKAPAPPGVEAPKPCLP
jgi:hypothetical protein